MRCLKLSCLNSDQIIENINTPEFIDRLKNKAYRVREDFDSFENIFRFLNFSFLNFSLNL